VLAVLAWIVFLVEVVIWLVTIIPNLVLDVVLLWAREIVYEFQCAAWTLFLLARRALVMSAFLMPKPEEVDLGLTTLGRAGSDFDILKALDDPQGDGPRRRRSTSRPGGSRRPRRSTWTGSTRAMSCGR
jgi:hypothetical protein